MDSKDDHTYVGYNSSNVSHFGSGNLIWLFSYLYVLFQANVLCTYWFLTVIYPRMCINVHILHHVSFVFCLISSLLYGNDIVLLSSIKSALLFRLLLQPVLKEYQSRTKQIFLLETNTHYTSTQVFLFNTLGSFPRLSCCWSYALFSIPTSIFNPICIINTKASVYDQELYFFVLPQLLLPWFLKNKF